MSFFLVERLANFLSVLKMATTVYEREICIDAIPAQRRQSLKLNGCVNKGPFVLRDRMYLVLNNQDE